MVTAVVRDKITSLRLASVVLLLCLAATSASQPETDAFVFGGCTEQKYSPESDAAYGANVNSLLTSLVNSATYSSYDNFTVTADGSRSGPGAVSGLFQCRGDLAMPDCATCVARAVTRLGALCPGQACGGAVQLQGCYVKYDNATFVGEEDKTVVLKKCGPSVGYDDQGFAKRDAVMAALAGGGGGYRVGGAGDVRGVAQCVGDLSVAECQDCVAEAVARLKSDCGQAVYGDMFLGKCYARYSTGGAHFSPSSHGDDHEKSSDEGEKTFAVIIGLLAGVALIIIFLAFLRKICEGPGKS